MRYLSVWDFVLAADDGGVTNHDTLYGVIFTGIVSIILAYLGYLSNSRKSKTDNTPTGPPAPVPSPAVPVNDNRDEVLDLRRQRDAVQRKYDTLQINCGKQAIEISRLRELLIENDIDPDVGSIMIPIVLQPPTPPVDLRRRPRPQ